MEELLSLPNLAEILLYHVVAGYYTTNELLQFDGLITQKPDEQVIYINSNDYNPVDGSGLKLISQQGGEAQIVLSNLQANNGIVQVIDSVLLPLFDTVIQIATSFDDFSVLVIALNQERLIDTLSGDGPFTVFAPNNNAFVTLLNVLDVSPEQLLAVPILKDILLYHVVGDNLSLDELLSLNGLTVPTLKSDSQTLKISGGISYDPLTNSEGVNIIDQQESQSSIILPNVQAKNGVVHVVDTVLLPLFDTVVQIAASFDKFNILVQAVNIAGLTDDLSDPDGEFTVFAPTNEAFVQLINELDVSVDDILRLPNLKDVLLYHVLNEKVLTSELANRESVTTLKSDKQTVNINDGLSNIELFDQQSDESNIGLADVQAKNGVAHVIDRVLIPLFDSVYQVATLFDDYSILVTLVQKAGLVDELTGRGDFTVFAPNNNAFYKLIDELRVEIEDIINLPILEQVLFYHIIGDYLLAKDLANRDGQNLVTLRDDKQTLKLDANNYYPNDGFAVTGIKLMDNQNDVSNIFIGDVETKNGVVFVVNRVLIPLFDSIVQVATSFDDYSILVKLVIEAGLADLLSDGGSGPFTVFAPNNKAFERLMFEIQINIDDLINLPILRDVLFYHLLDGYILSYDLSTKQYETLKSDKQEIYINTDNYTPVQGFAISGIDVVDAQSDKANMIIGNVETRNGVVHVIDRVLIPLFDSVYQVATSFDDYSILVKLVNEAGLDDDLQGNGPFTVFAPNNRAFEILMDALLINIDDLLNLPILKDVLFYHIPGQYLLAQDLPNGDLKTLKPDGQSIFVDMDNNKFIEGFVIDGIDIIDNQHDRANILFGNVETKNGVVHVIDRVLIPLFNSIVQIATSFDDYTILVKLVEEAGLVPLLSDPNSGPFTVFAPNNRAFEILMDQININIDDLINLPILKEVLFYHLLSGGSLTSQLPTSDYKTIRTDQQSIYIDNNYNGDDVFDVSGIYVTDNQHDTANVIIGNVEAENGVVHVIDRVLIPLFDSIVQVATSFDDYTILVQLVQEAGLVDVLTNDGPFTVFAPNNDAFFRLMDALLINIDDLLNLPILKEVLFYHLLNGYKLSVDLPTGNYETVRTDKQTIYINSDNSNDNTGFDVTGIYVTDNQHDTANVLFGNVEAKNGVVHVIDAVLIPLFDSIVQVATSFDDYSILVQLVQEAGLVGLLSDPTEGPFTVFAPNNNAFYNLMDELLINIDDLLNLPILKEVLFYHLLNGYYLTSGLPTGDVKTVNGQEVNINKDNYYSDNDGFAVSGIYLVDNQHDVSDMIIGNVETRNGVVNVINRVLIPLFDSVYQVATSFNDYSLLVQLVQKANLVDELTGNGPFTVWAPNNNAFQKLLDELLIDFEDVLNLPILEDVLRYHILGDYLLSYDISSGNYQTIKSDKQSIYINTDNYNGGQGFDITGIKLMDNQARSMNTLLGNVETANGVVHVIDRVMVPLFTDIIQIATSFDDYTILVLLVETAGLVDTLINDGPFTVFAPNNNAFYQLLDELLIEVDDLVRIPLPVLKDILFYHIIGDRLLSTDLPTGTYETLKSDKQSIYINSDNYNGYTDGFDITGIYTTDKQDDDRSVIIGNVQAENGIVHVVDRVQIPLFDSVYQVATSFDDYSILVDLLQVAGLVGTVTDPDATFTVFAPNNVAMNNLLDELQITYDDLINIPSLRDILLYHVLGRYLLSKDLNTGNYETLKSDGQSIYINSDNHNYQQGFAVSGIKITDNQNDIRDVIIGNVETKNGVVFVVNRVMIPLFDSVYQIATSFDDYTILVQLVKVAGLENDLQDPDGIFTVFAPNNDAFNKLLNELLITIDDLINIPLPVLTEILFYHILGSYKLIYDLPTGDYQTLRADKQSIFVNTDNYDGRQGFDINGVFNVDNQKRTADGIIGNVESKNGVVHVIDRVQIPVFDDIVQIATSFDDYSILVDLVEVAGLVDELQGPGDFTVFAPNNNAFYKLLNELRIEIDDLIRLPKDILTDILYYHMIGDFLISTDLSTRSYQTLKSDKQSININTDNYDGYTGGFDIRGIYVIDQQSDQSNVIIGNVRAQNGVVHVVDRVLIPLFDNVYQVATSFDDYSILVQLVQHAGLVDALTDPDATFTVFAPNNDAMYRLLEELDVTLDDVLNIPSLRDILLYHLLPIELLAKDLTPGDYTTVNGQKLYINNDNYKGDDGFDITGITLKDQQMRNAFTLLGNVETKNGVVHVIDRVLVPLFESVVEIARSFDDYTIVVDALEQEGLIPTLEDPDGTFSVFAPNNEAFALLEAELGPDITLDDIFAIPILDQILLYHVVGDFLTTTDLDAQNGKAIATLKADSQAIIPNTDNINEIDVFRVRGIFIDDQQFRSSDVILTNVRAKNGIAHVINRVMLPLFDTIVQIAASFPSQFSILVEAVIRANLTETLTDPAGTFTVFAPTNDAFIYLADMLGITVADILDMPNLKDILFYHILGDIVLTTDLIDGQELITLKSDKQTITVSNDGFEDTPIQLIDKQQFDVSNIGLSNVRAKNGVAHVIDHILIPYFDTVVDIAASFPVLFSILVTAVDHVGLTDDLSDPSGTFTVFAPPNQAFNTLLFALDIDVDDLLQIPNLDEILLYHVLGNEMFIDDIVAKDGQEITTLKPPDFQTFTVDATNYNPDDESGVVLIDQQTLERQIVLADVKAFNGVAHVITTGLEVPLLPIFDTVVQIAEMFPSRFSILIQALIAADLRDVLLGNGPFTVFAPTNEAFNNLLIELNLNLNDLLNDPNLDTILLYNCIDGFVTTSEMRGNNGGDLTTKTGGTLRINIVPPILPDVVEDQVDLIDNNGRTATKISPPDEVYAKNGLVHIIDTVLLPIL